MPRPTLRAHRLTQSGYRIALLPLRAGAPTGRVNEAATAGSRGGVAHAKRPKGATPTAGGITHALPAGARSQVGITTLAPRTAPATLLVTHTEPCRRITTVPRRATPALWRLTKTAGRRANIGVAHQVPSAGPTAAKITGALPTGARSQSVITALPGGAAPPTLPVTNARTTSGRVTIKIAALAGSTGVAAGLVTHAEPTLRITALSYGAPSSAGGVGLTESIHQAPLHCVPRAPRSLPTRILSERLTSGHATAPIIPAGEPPWAGTRGA